MLQKSIIRQARFILAIIAILLLFGTTATLTLIDQQYNNSIELHKQEEKNNLIFISKMLKKYYLNQNYTLIEKTLEQWIKDYTDIASIRLVAANSYELAYFEKDIKPLHYNEISHDIIDDNNRLLLTITVKYNHKMFVESFQAAKNKFIVIAIIFGGLLGLALLYINRNMIVVPLEKEISQRINAETELKKLNQELDKRVIQRTQEISEKNGKLKQLINEQEMTLEQMHILSSAIQQSQDSIVITDSESRIEYVNPAFEKITGYSYDEAIGKTPALIKSGMHDAQYYQLLWKTLKSGESFSDVFTNRKKDNSIYYEQRTITPIKNKNGTIINYLATGKDITEHMKNQERLQFMATHDALTELPNRSMLRDRLNHAINQAERNNTRVAVMFLDLDRFKHINDSLGHQVGDKLLQQSSERLSVCVRKGDTLARLGGDEFTIVMESFTDVDDISNVAQKIILTLSEPFEIDGYEMSTSTSIGITIYPEDADNTDSLLKNADTAMYRAKKHGGSSYEYYTEDMTHRAVRRLELQNQLSHAMEHNELTVLYQPRINLSTGHVQGMEALLRWNSPKFGKVMPDEFIPILEETGMIVGVGNWVIEQALKFNETLRSQGLKPVRVSVNLSARQFRGKETLKHIKQLSKTYCMMGGCLEIEITESLLMENIDMASSIIHQLSSLGIYVSVDDFGTGYSSMGYLKSFNLDALKIDRSFIKDLPHDKDFVAITQAIIALAHTLDLSVVAEGIETEQQLNFLRENKCDEVQGYFISKPLTEKKFLKWLSENQDTILDIPTSKQKAG